MEHNTQDTAGSDLNIQFSKKQQKRCILS